MSTVKIQYQLLQAVANPIGGQSPVLEPVDSTDDLALEAEIAASDSSKQVQSVSPVEAQNEVLHDHVMAVPFELPIHGYSIVLDQFGSSLWDRELKAWIRVDNGGAIWFAVNKPGDEGRLFLAVKTEGATGAVGAPDDD